tara:strand:- start:218 stop:439 length:222 start_codon:yes stop_codon:yes gene_type:complete
MSWTDIIKNEENAELMSDVLYPIGALKDKLQMRSNVLSNQNEKLAADELFDVIIELRGLEKEIAKSLSEFLRD